MTPARTARPAGTARAARPARTPRAARTARTARVALVAALALAIAVLPACGSDSNVRGWLADRFGRTEARGDTESYRSTQPVDRTAAAIAAGVKPAARARDGSSEYLRFADDIVIVSAAAAGAGSTVRVEDLDDRFSRGQYAHLGSGFSPGSPAGKDGGPGDGK